MLSCLYQNVIWSTADLQGLAEHRDELGAPLCPCRHYDDKAAEAKQGFWNCPCVPMRERKVNDLPTVHSGHKQSYFASHQRLVMQTCTCRNQA